MSLYGTLGVLKDATAEQIKRAYKKLAQMHHPDKGGEREMFDHIQQAYDTLGDPEKRAEYDATGQIPGNKNPIRDQAMAEMARMITALVNHPALNFAQTDIVTQMELMVGQKLNEIDTNRSTVQTRLAKANDAKARLTSSKGDMAMQMILDHTTQEGNALVYQLNAAETVFKEVLSILDSYEYRVDVPPEPEYIEQPKSAWSIYKTPFGN